MEIRSRASAAVHAAIAEVTEAARVALNAGKFDDAAWCARLADELSKLSPDHAAVPPNAISIEKGNGTSDAVAVETRHQLPRREKQGRVSPLSAEPEGQRDGRGYPLFYRDRDTLIKVGWSKSQGGEYEHRAPKAVVDALAQAIMRAGPGEPTSMETLLPLRDDRGGEMPSYQAYLALAWLRACGAVRRHGQDGYSMTRRFASRDAIETLWGELTTSRPRIKL
jgi:hypothetical protein